MIITWGIVWRAVLWTILPGWLKPGKNHSRCVKCGQPLPWYMR